jgi:hypothetical protein
MPLPFPPNRGEVLICDFQNYMPKGEMVKLRPIIVLSPSIAQRMDIVTVVALSTTQPLTILNYHLEITFDPPYSIKYPSKTMYRTADLPQKIHRCFSYEGCRALCSCESRNYVGSCESRNYYLTFISQRCNIYMSLLCESIRLNPHRGRHVRRCTIWTWRFYVNKTRYFEHDRLVM